MGKLHNGPIANGWNEWGTVAYLPRSYRGLPSTSLKKTILPAIYFNKYDKNIILGVKIGVFTLKCTNVCLFWLKITISEVQHVHPIVPDIHDNSKLWKCVNYFLSSSFFLFSLHWSIDYCLCDDQVDYCTFSLIWQGGGGLPQFLEKTII